MQPVQIERLEGRALMASLAAISNQTIGAGIGLPIVLDSADTANQTFTATSSNSNISVSVPKGHFLTIGVSHTSSGTGDPSFSGTITFQMYGDITPTTVERIEQLVASGFYTSPTVPPSGGTVLTSKNFHRIVPGFVVQGGSQTGDGTGSFTGAGFPFLNEQAQQLVFNGNYQVAMANAGRDTNDTQFFITTGQQRSLDYNYTLFGQVVAGTDIVDKMFAVATNSTTNAPLSPILITSSVLSDVNPDGVLLVDTTKASVGETATVTVTATDPSNNTTTSQTFTVTVGQNVGPDGKVVQEPPFLNPVANQVVATNQTDIFQLSAVNPSGNPLSYVVAGGITGSGSSATFSAVSNATATVDANGTVTVVPNAGFTGVINLLVGVQDNQVRNGGVAVGNPANYYTRKLTLTVRDGAVVNLPPIAAAGSANVVTNTTATIQLTGNTANPGTSQTLTYQIVTAPQHGTISNFDAATGRFSYTPSIDYLGTDTVQFQVTQVGASPNLTSQPATFTINVTGAETGYVRLLDGVLLISAPPRNTGTNIILVNQVSGKLQVSINGQIDATMPAVADVDSISIYGSKGNDEIRVDPNITIRSTISGGRGGRNTLVGGGGSARLHGWFGRNTLVSGAKPSVLYGKAGVVRFKPKQKADLMYAGTGTSASYQHWASYATSRAKNRPTEPPSGSFYRLVNGRIVPVTLRPAVILRKDVPRVGSKFDRNFG